MASAKTAFRSQRYARKNEGERLSTAVSSIRRLYRNAARGSGAHHKIEYRQGLRDALEAMKHYGVIKDYSLGE